MDESPSFDVFIAENGGPAAMDSLLAMLKAGDAAWQQADDAEPPVTPDHALRLRTYRLNRRTPGASHVYVAEMTENLGYAGGINAWLRPLLAVDGWKAAWILNPDTEPRPDALAKLSAASERRRKGMVGSLIVRPDAQEVVAMRGLRWQKWMGRSTSVGRQEAASVEPDASAVETKMTAPSGASMYVTRSLIERIGLMYDPYFLYYEDLEWGARAKKIGELGYANDSVVLHKHGTTIGSSGDKAGRSPLSVYLGARNAVLFSRRNYPAFVLPALAMQFVQATRYLHAGSTENFRTALQGIVAGYRGETGRPDPMPGARKTVTDKARDDCASPAHHPDARSIPPTP